MPTFLTSSEKDFMSLKIITAPYKFKKKRKREKKLKALEMKRDCTLTSSQDLPALLTILSIMIKL